MPAQLDSALFRAFLPLVASPGGLDFDLPSELEAGEPPEARGLARDEVRLMVSYRAEERIIHTAFRKLPAFLAPGDVVVINTSGTLNAAVAGRRTDGAPIALHLSTRLPDGQWVVEVRLPEGNATQPFYGAAAGEVLSLPGGGAAALHTPYRPGPSGPIRQGVHLWTAALDLPLPLEEYLAQYGFPIRYGHVAQAWPLEYYQTVYATEPGSAEMPSAGRAFTLELIARLAAKGVQIAPLLLHTGVSSQEEGEAPGEEFYRVPPATARLVNLAHAAGRRVVAVGTTAIRALETTADRENLVHPGSGWSRLVITPDRPLRMVDALLTGFHEPRASHLAMLEALAGSAHLRLAYAEALRERYLWHEFGDLHLILP
ncbi:MAG: S-adenosylmethionine:tRNA ribosyltransferase-isomerase [Candidatus Latescibacteria bacterium]|nr:S-adenosylmethionine:tRNA ribosyltransferase-isomerase [Candidatus Latescibacterota bacterium]